MSALQNLILNCLQVLTAVSIIACSSSNTVTPPDTYSITGKISGNSNDIEGVTIQCGEKNTKSDASGTYSISELKGSSYSLTPTKSGFTFTPPTIAFTLKRDTTLPNIQISKNDSNIQKSSEFQPERGTVGARVTLLGKDFGVVQGSSIVKIGESQVSIITWSNSKIEFLVPNGATTGVITVQTPTKKISTSSPFYVLEPMGNVSANCSTSVNIMFNPDDTKLFSFYEGRTFDVGTGQFLWKTGNSIYSRTDIDFSKDGKLLFEKSDYFINAYNYTSSDPTTNHHLYEIELHNRVHAFKVLSQNSLLLITDSAFLRIDATTGSVQSSTPFFTSSENTRYDYIDVKFSEDGKRVLIQNNDVSYLVNIVDCMSGSLLGKFEKGDDYDPLPSISPDGKSLLTYKNTSVILWDISSGTPKQTKSYIFETDVNEVQFSPSGKKMGVRTVDGKIKVIGLQDERLYTEIVSDDLHSFTFGHNTPWLAVVECTLIKWYFIGEL